VYKILHVPSHSVILLIELVVSALNSKCLACSCLCKTDFLEEKKKKRYCNIRRKHQSTSGNILRLSSK